MMKKSIICVIAIMLLSLTLPIIKATNAESFSLTGTVNLQAAAGKGGVDLDWSGYDSTDKVFMGYQKQEGKNTWTPISTVDFYSQMEPIKVLNIYPIGSEKQLSAEDPTYIPKVTFKYSNGEEERLPKSAALKVWLEGGTIIEDSGEVSTFQALGINPYTGQQLLYVTPISTNEFMGNINAWSSDIWNYDIVMLGTWDCNGSEKDQMNDAALELLERYINQGYGVLAGHDTIGYSYGDLGLNKLRKYFNIKIGNFGEDSQTTIKQGVDYQDSWAYLANHVTVDKQGLLTNFPWELPAGAVLTIPQAHTCANAALGDVWMNFYDGEWVDIWTPNGSYTHGEGNGTYYLTTNNNTAMIQTGHSRCTSTEDEIKVLANTMFYLKQRTIYTSVTDNSSQDFAAPDAPTLTLQGVNSKNEVTIGTTANDNGTTYSFKVEARDRYDYTKLIATSNEIKLTVTTGVKGYYYVADNNETNDFDITNARYTETNVIALGQTDGKHLHVKAVDVAGNVGPVSDLNIIIDVAVNVEKTSKWVDADNAIAEVTLSVEGKKFPNVQSEALDVVIVLDRSSSMLTNNRLSLSKKSIIQLANDMYENVPDSRIAVTAFTDEIQIINDFATKEDKDKLIKNVNNIDCGYGTNYDLGLNSALELIHNRTNEYKDRKTYVIFVSDGEPSSNGVVVANKLKQEGVLIYDIGIDITNAQYIQNIVSTDSLGNQLYYNIKSPEDFQKIFDEVYVALSNSVAKNVVFTDRVNTKYFDLVSAQDLDNRVSVIDNSQIVWNIGILGSETETTTFKIQLKDEYRYTDTQNTGKKFLTNDDSSKTLGAKLTYEKIETINGYPVHYTTDSELEVKSPILTYKYKSGAITVAVDKNQPNVGNVYFGLFTDTTSSKTNMFAKMSYNNDNTIVFSGITRNKKYYVYTVDSNGNKIDDRVSYTVTSISAKVTKMKNGFKIQGTLNSKITETPDDARPKNVTMDILTVETENHYINYRIADPELKNNIVKQATANEINRQTGLPVLTKLGGSVKYTVTYHIEIDHYIGKSVITIVDKLPAEISTKRSNLSGGTYNKNNNTISWQVTLDGIDSVSVNEAYEQDIIVSMELYYINQPDLRADLTNTATGIAQIYYSKINPIKPGQEQDRILASCDATVEQKYKTNIAGKVWLDDNINGSVGDSEDIAMSNITVVLHQKDESGEDKTISETKTDSNGNYQFSQLDGAKEYYVEFKYNGQYYEPTKYMAEDVSIRNSSKGVDIISEREALNNKFAEIAASPNNYMIGNKNRTVYLRNDLYNDGYIDAFGNPTNVNKAYVQDSMTSSYTGYNENGVFYTQCYPSKEVSKKYGLEWPNDTVNEYINQGFVLRETPDIAINSDIEKAYLAINGYTQEYTYNKKDNVWDLSQRVEQNYYNTYYTRELYKSDYYYQGNSPLEMYVTYKIAIKNQSKTIAMQPTEIVDFYDANYTFDTEKYKPYITDKDGNIIRSDIMKINTNSKYNSSQLINGYNNLYLSFDNVLIAPEGEIDIYVTFEVNRNNGLLNLDSKNNIVEINGYKTYYTSSSHSPNEGSTKTTQEYYAGKIAGLVDGDSIPGNVNTNAIEILGKDFSLVGVSANELKSKYGIEDDTDISTSITSTYKDENGNNITRKISGTVWEDVRNLEKAEDYVTIGDGENNNEKVIQGVKVQLIDLRKSTGTNFSVAMTLQADEWKEATITTDENGNYTIEGFIPSEYIVIFTYGENGGKYNGQDYKSTIYYAPSRTNNNFDVNNPDTTTYNYDLAQAYGDSVNGIYRSDARDIMGNETTIGTRMYVNNYCNNNGEGVTNLLAQELKDIESGTASATINENTKIIAQSGKIIADIEYDRIKSDTSSNGANNIGTNVYELSSFYHIEHLDFGMVERAKAQLKVTKQVTNVNLQLANEATLFDASGPATNVLWISHKAHGIEENDETETDTNLNKDTNNTYKTEYNYINQLMREPVVRQEARNKGIIQLTMDQEIMHGAMLKITYAIIVANIGEVDYTSNQYYYTGNKAKNDSYVTTTADTIIDYVGTQVHDALSLDDLTATRNNQKFIAKDNPNWNIISIKDIKDSNLLSEKALKGAKEYTTIITTDQLSNKELVPIITNQKGKNDATEIQNWLKRDMLNAVSKINDTYVEQQSSVAATSLVLTQTITPDNKNDDLQYNNLTELVKTSNTAGRKMAYSIVGNQDPKKEPVEIDSDVSQEVTIMPPFGQSYIYYVLGTIIATILIAGISITMVVLKKKK